MVEKSFDEIADWAPAILWVTDPAGACTYLSRGWYEFTGQMLDEGLGFGWVAAVHPDDREPSAQIFLRANEKRVPFTLDYRLRRRDGRYSWAIDAGNPRFGRDGEFLGMVGSVLDISERKEMEESLRQTEARLRRLVDTAAEGIWIVDAGGSTSYLNRRMADMLGYEPQHVIGRSPLDFAVDDETRAQLERALADRATVVSQVVEMRLRHRGGSEVAVLVNTNPLRDENGEFDGTLAMVTDVTAHKELERRLLQSQKMDAIGRLAGGVAHDFNNLLTAIGGHTRLVIEQLDERDTARQDLLEVERAVERASALTRQLLAFSRQESSRPSVVDLNSLVGDFERMLRRTIGADILLDVRTDDTVPPVRVDAVQIEQVLLNLANNARDAMPDGGRLTIETRRFPPSHGRRGVPPPEHGAFAGIIVRDTGIGMDETTRQRIFEPFFTTKPMGKGTGLGLATVHGIVEQAGGTIHLETAAGAGSTFTVLLPAADGAAPPAETRQLEPLPRGHEEILVVEDEDTVRSLAVRILSQLGYRMTAAATADEGLRLLETGRRFDLVVTDMILPGLSGRDFARHAQDLERPVRFMFMSGYSPEEPLRAMADAANVPFLEKPFRPEDLARAVRAALDE